MNEMSKKHLISRYYSYGTTRIRNDNPKKHSRNGGMKKEINKKSKSKSARA